MSQRIVIDLYDHTPQDEVDEILADLKRIGIDDARHSSRRNLTAIEVSAREKVWTASQNGKPVNLTAGETQALWQSILLDGK